jgi:UrcA family protein
MKTFKLLTLAAAALAGLAGNASAAARIVADSPSVVVHYGDLDLNTKAGVTKLHARLRNAARDVCAPLNSRVLGLREQYESCVTKAVTQSVAAVGHSSLSRYHRHGVKPALVAAHRR